MKVVIETLGCKLNQAETESLAWQFSADGYEVIADELQADIYILNTCTVTATADAKARQRLRSIHQHNPRAFIVAAGCYVEREPHSLVTMPDVDLVIGNRDKANLVSLVNSGIGRCSPSMLGIAGSSIPGALRTRSLIKVQDGCNGNCSYCIVPTVRTGNTSIPIEVVVTQIRERLQRGVKEIVITGTEVGSYRDGDLTVKDLLATVLAQTDVPRLRLSSLQPQEISPGLVSLWHDDRLCPHFHLSIQSGSDDILRLMRRRYTVNQYAAAVSLIRRTLPDVAITTDVIVGFPGETDAMFEEGLRTCRDLRFARVHVFPFSPRPGTEAAAMRKAVPAPVKKARAGQMLSLAEESAAAFRATFAGTTRPVLWEHRNSRGRWTGFTDNYIPLETDSPEDLENRILPAMVR